MRARAAAALFLIAAPWMPAAPAWAEEAEKTPEQIEAEVKASEEALERLRNKAVSVLDELEAAEAALRELQRAAEQAEAALKAASARVASAELDEQAARDALIAQLDLLAPRLRARYQLSKARRASLLLSARSVGEMLRRKRALEDVLAGDLRMLELARSSFERLEARRLELAAAKLEHEERAKAALERRAQAKRRKDELAALHDALLAEQGLREKTLEELYKAQARLSRHVRRLEAADDGEGFAKLKGRLPFPTDGYIEVGFGKVLNPKFNTVTFQNGLDFRAPEGTDVKAVAAGTVVHASAFRGYGNLVIIDHGDGYHTLYAHLASIGPQVGEAVEAGAVLGQVGDTGSLKGAYLYFELRKKGKPIDPKEWLGSH
ncbi:MAG: murein hydrolase activator EnvC family protein [Myxococcales bacterium]|jgi:septal ring factor EnvC (AmiA/AmiB activator)